MELMHAVVTQESAKISCNFEQIENAIKEKLSQYEGIVFEEGSKTYAKKDVAMLRAEKKTFQDNLREEKRKYMAPWEAFETRARALINMYDKPINLINGQLQAFEEKRIEEKKELTRKIYSEAVPDSLRDYIPLKSIYSPKWENATIKEKAIRQEITAAAERVGSDISTIREMQSEGEEEAVRIYKKNLNLSEAVAYLSKYERQKQEILAKEQERRRAEEENRIRMEERERLLKEQKIKDDMEAAARKAEEEKAAAVEEARQAAEQEVMDRLIPDDFEGKAVSYRYRIHLTPDAKNKLEMFMDSVGIEWEILEG